MKLIEKKEIWIAIGVCLGNGQKMYLVWKQMSLKAYKKTSTKRIAGVFDDGRIKYQS